MKCIHCERKRPACGFYPMLGMGGTIINEDGSTYTIYGQLCLDCDKWLRDGRPPRITPLEESK